MAPASGRSRLRTLPQEPRLVLIDELERLAQAVRGRGDELDAVARARASSPKDVGTCLEPPRPDLVVWSEPGLLAYAPVDVSERLRDSLWSEGPTAVLVSATLELGFVERRLGLEHAARFDAELAVRLPHAGAALRPAPDGRAARGGGRGRGRGALPAVPRARPRADHVVPDARDDRLAPARAAAYEVLVQGDAPRERLLERFRTETDSVLVATARFWQGIDLAGESLSLLVMDKLPFASPGDPLTEARCERIAERGGDWFRDYALPVATLQLRQGFGRLVRSHADRGVAAMLDPRMYTRAYGRHLLDALPSCPLVDDRAEVERFFADEAVAV